MFTNLKYSWLFFKRGGWRALLNVSILFVTFTAMGTVVDFYTHIPMIHIPIILYLLIYYDNGNMRFSSPIELTHILTFPQSISKKFLRLITIEGTGLKLYLILVYMLIQCIVNQLYLHPAIILYCLITFLIYHFLFIPFLLMARRQMAYSVIFRSFAPIVFFVPLLLTKKHGSRGLLFKAIKDGYNHHVLIIGIGFILAGLLSYFIGRFFFVRISRQYPFLNQEVVEKFSKRRF
jgi:hypothetical protein